MECEMMMGIQRTGFLFLFAAFCVSACFRYYDWDRDIEVLDKEEVVCVPPSRLEITGSGKSGLMKFCRILDGPFIVAKDGYIWMRGQYDAWQKTGVWVIYDENGNAVKTIDYSSKEDRYP